MGLVSVKKRVLVVAGVLAVLPVVVAAQKRIAGFIEPMPTAKLRPFARARARWRVRCSRQTRSGER